MKTEEILKINSRRFVSHTTRINCAHCGNDFKINNREPIPFEYQTINKNIGKIYLKCPNCKEEYDLGICSYK